MTITEPYSVSEGTLHPRDLIPVFLDEVEKLDPTAYAELLSDETYGSSVRRIRHVQMHLEGDLRSDVDWYAESIGWLLNELHERLEDLAPEGLYWGTAEGDGAAFGFWAIEEDE